MVVNDLTILIGYQAKITYNLFMEVITSLENKKIKLFASLKEKKYRDKYQLFVVQEKHLIDLAIKNKAIDTLIILEGKENIFNIDAMYVNSNVMKKLSDNVSLNDYIAICKISNIKTNSNKTIVLENVQDPGNIGTIIRSAYSFGFEKIYLSNDCCDLYNSKTVSASQGSIFMVETKRMTIKEIFDELKKEKYQIICTDLHTDNCLSNIEYKEKIAVIFGNEGQGISQFVRDNSDLKLKIEMQNFESLNVAVAAGIVMYELSKD